MNQVIVISTTLKIVKFTQLMEIILNLSTFLNYIYIYIYIYISDNINL
jgi:hypothetical protein